MFLEMIMNEFYGEVALSRSTKERYDSGYWSVVRPHCRGQVKKTSTSSFGLEQEYSNMLRVWHETAFRAMPTPVSLEDDGDSIVMSSVEHGIQLGDLLEVAPKFLGRHVIDVLYDVVETLHLSGWTHNDLHERNVLVGLDRHQNWVVYLIDWATAKESNDKERDLASLRAAIGQFGYDPPQ